MALDHRPPPGASLPPPWGRERVGGATYDTRRPTGHYQRFSASSSASFADTHSAPSAPISFFQNGARDFR